jgi:hypothetical protein
MAFKPPGYVVPMSISVRYDQAEDIDKFQSAHGLASRSAAVRTILDEWKGMVESLNMSAANLDLARKEAAMAGASE